MFVTESNIFDPGNIKIRVSSMDGGDILLEVKPEITVDHLKVQISSHLYDPVESVKTSLYHRLLHVSTGRVMQEDRTLAQCGVKDNDELLLIKKRIPGPSLEGTESKIREDSKKTPATEDVRQATQSLPSANMDRTKTSSSHNSHFKDELRKILISLIDAAQKILCLNPEAAKLFVEAEKSLLEASSVVASTPKPQGQSEVNPESLAQITAMGFPESRARKALKLNGMSPPDAIQWLLEHECDVDIDDDDTAPPGDIQTDPQSPESVASSDPDDLSAVDQACALECAHDNNESPDGNSDDFMCEAFRLARLKGAEKVKRMLRGFRTYRRRQFKPNPKAMKTLVEMGFTEHDALDALCIHGNQQDEACEWLLAGGHTKSLEEDLGPGLQTDGPVYKAIMSNPVVQLGISNPKSLLAFLTILENPNSTQQWLNDPDTGPMLIQVSRIYHAERQLNQ